MLTFSHAQMQQLQQHSLIEQRRSQAPQLLATLSEAYPGFCADKGAAVLLDYLLGQIPTLVGLHYRSLEQVQQFLLLQFHWQQTLHDSPALQALCGALWMEAGDRLDALAYCKAQPEVLPTGSQPALYQTLGSTAAQARQQAIRQQARLAAGTDAGHPAGLHLNLLRHSLYYNLRHSHGWQAWRSQWRQAELAVQQPAQQRGIRLHPLAGTGHPPGATPNATLAEADGLAVLAIGLPDTLSFSDTSLGLLQGWLDAWVQDLLPADAMRQRLQPETAPASASPAGSSTTHPTSEGGQHA